MFLRVYSKGYLFSCLLFVISSMRMRGRDTQETVMVLADLNSFSEDQQYEVHSLFRHAVYLPNSSSLLY